MLKIETVLEGLTDEEILDEFVKRFKCDGAILIYLESHTEFGFARWRNSVGKKWVNELFKTAQEDNNIRKGTQSIHRYENMSFVT